MSASTSLTVQVPLSIRRRPGRKTVVTPDGTASAAIPALTISTRTDPALVKALARAFRYQRLLDEGLYASITEIAEAEKLDRGYMGRLLQLTLLAPGLIEAVLNGTPCPVIGLPGLLKSVPAAWREQAVEPG
ncbi:hypothetical protein D9599_08875 [Roseomonas sp. KE2513]|uniref:hypothetical protein n=1 Tax=Roseomonas sp. KE2513 TaxID=2479202 RepID=UPI0018DFE41F|nr:hypothetical protein [Roseomonas sp. KE2513]MBI0535685.1 hypothetical protein [Roseomonas sp. KE2513]